MVNAQEKTNRQKKGACVCATLPSGHVPLRILRKFAEFVAGICYVFGSTIARRRVGWLAHWEMLLWFKPLQGRRFGLMALAKVTSVGLVSAELLRHGSLPFPVKALLSTSVPVHRSRRLAEERQEL
jgi:hypothetical protein